MKRTMITLVTVTIASLATLFTLGSFHATAANAATRAPSWTQRTCSAFATWQHHKTTAHLDAIMTSSLHVAWKYLGEDADDLYRAVRAGKNTDTAVQYFYEDCNNGSGL